MKICILGLGVIGTTYGYVWQQAGYQVEHWIREGKRAAAPDRIAVRLLDGRRDVRGEEKKDQYAVALAQPDTAYDFIVVSVAAGSLSSAFETIAANRLTGTLLLFCNFWDDRAALEAMLGDRPYIVGFPTAGGRMEQGTLDCALFDHIMLERRERARIGKYDELLELLEHAGLKAETPYDMVEWIWIHMAVNAGVTATAARAGNLENPKQLALELMRDGKALAEAVRTIRETLRVVTARGVDLARYRSELLPYRIPAGIAGRVMKRMFAANELTRRIMTLHGDVRDIFYGCDCVYREAQRRGLDLPRYYQKMERIAAAMCV